MDQMFRHLQPILVDECVPHESFLLRQTVFFCIEKNNSETLTPNEACYEYYDSLIILEVWGLVFSIIEK